MKEKVIIVCWIIIFFSFLLSKIFPEGTMFLISLILGFSAFATYAVTAMIEEEED